MSLIRFILVFLIGWILYRAVRIMLGLTGRRSVRGRDGGVIDKGEMVRDPACGTFLSREDAVTLRRGGETLYFCSPRCRDRYLDGDGDEAAEVGGE